MGRVKGVKEKLHSPIYDAFFVPQGLNFQTEMNRRDPRVIRFFTDIQDKTRLETNLQAAGVLPSLNTLEVRAMRVVASTAPLRLFVDRPTIVAAATAYRNSPPLAVAAGVPPVVPAGAAEENNLFNAIQAEFERATGVVNSILPELIYSSVTTLLVGEKIMIEVPTYWFPAGAGVTSGNGTVTNHGAPDPMATFRFSEPVLIEPNQNFRVEMLFPRGLPGQAGFPGNLANVAGPLRLWVVLDGYLTRDVQ